MEDLNTLSKEELVVLAEKQQTELATVRSCSNYYREENEKLKKKLETIQNILTL